MRTRFPVLVLVCGTPTRSRCTTTHGTTGARRTPALSAQAATMYREGGIGGCRPPNQLKSTGYRQLSCNPFLFLSTVCLTKEKESSQPLKVKPTEQLHYKYYDPSGLSTLDSGVIHLKHPSAFNDPFEMNPHLYSCAAFQL